MFEVFLESNLRLVICSPNVHVSSDFGFKLTRRPSSDVFSSASFAYSSAVNPLIVSVVNSFWMTVMFLFAVRVPSSRDECCLVNLETLASSCLLYSSRKSFEVDARS